MTESPERPRDGSGGSIRICLVSEVFYPQDPGGQGPQAHALAQALAERGVAVRVVTRLLSDQAPSPAKLGDIQVSWLRPSGMWKGKGWRAIRPMTQFLARLFMELAWRLPPYDLVLVQGVKTILLPVALASRIRRAALVIKVDAISEIEQGLSRESLQSMAISEGSLLVRLWDSVRSALLRAGDAVVAISEETAAAVLAHDVPHDKIRVIPNGIDLAAFAPPDSEDRGDSRAALDLPANKILVAYSGRLARSKGVMELASAWSRIQAKHPETHLVLIGSGAGSHDDCEDELREFVQTHSLSASITFVGVVGNVARWLRCVDLYVFPSEAEGFGIALVEAMAAGLPCISTRVGVAPEVIVDRQNGLLVPVGDSNALQEALEWMIVNRGSWRKLGLRARSAVVARYGMEVVADRYVSLFEEVR